MSDPIDKEDLPQKFTVRYLGESEAGGLWGIRQTRSAVDKLVKRSSNATPATETLTVSLEGVTLASNRFPIATISYGVQDLLYTRVFAMIVVGGESPFRCHAFACESRSSARRLTHCLAAAFAAFSAPDRPRPLPTAPKYAIDLRTPEELHADFRDSEA